MGLGDSRRASGPKESTQDTNESVSLAGTSASNHRSLRVLIGRTPGVDATAHQATFGLNATRAVAAGRPNPHGPASSFADASKPSGGGAARPMSRTSDSIRDSRNERTSLRARSIPTRYQLPRRKARANGSTSRTPALPCADRYLKRTARRRESASAIDPR